MLRNREIDHGVLNTKSLKCVYKKKVTYDSLPHVMSARLVRRMSFLKQRYTCSL